MSESRELAKPKFIKVKDLETHRSGFNVYCKVVSADPKVIDAHDGQKIPMVNCVLADETASANAFFKGEHSNLVKKGNVIAIRNGLKRFIKDHISLEIDIFGRVTLQNDVTVNVAEGPNISDGQHKLDRKNFNRRRDDRRPRRDVDRSRRFGGDRPRRQGDRPRRQEDRPRRQGDRPRRQNDRPRRQNDRPRRQEDRPRRQEDRPRRQEDRPRRQEDRPRRQERERPPREDRPRREVEDRPRREVEDRPRNEPREDRRGNREQRGDRKENTRRYDRDYDRRDRNDRNNRQYRPKREYAEKRQDNRGDRKPLNWTRIADIMPADENLNLNVKIISLLKVGGKTTKYRCVVGDSTGIANAFLPNKIELREDDHVVLFNVKAEVVQEHIELQLEYNGGRMELSRRPVEQVSEDFNLSAKAWVPIE